MSKIHPGQSHRVQGGERRCLPQVGSRVVRESWDTPVRNPDSHMWEEFASEAPNLQFRSSLRAFVDKALFSDPIIVDKELFSGPVITAQVY